MIKTSSELVEGVLAEESFTVVFGADAETFSDFDGALSRAGTLLNGPELVTIISSSRRRWEGAELTDLLKRSGRV
jgi:hypothetical protein